MPPRKAGPSVHFFRDDDPQATGENGHSPSRLSRPPPSDPRSNERVQPDRLAGIRRLISLRPDQGERRWRRATGDRDIRESMFRQCHFNSSSPRQNQPLSVVCMDLDHVGLGAAPRRDKQAVIKRPAKPVSPRTSDALLAGQPLANNAKARPPSWRVGAFGYAIHGLALLLLSLWVFSHFGQVFWFFHWLARPSAQIPCTARMSSSAAPPSRRPSGLLR